MRYLTSTLLIVAFTALTPPALMGQHDLGNVNFETSCSPEVESDFETGLALLHHMMYEQAEEEFKAVASADPSCAMAYWGMAMTQLHPLWAPPTEQELQKGREAVRQAKARETPTEREQAYIAAITAYFEEAPDRDTHPARLAAWEAAQEKLHQAYPDDVDAGAFYALSHLATASPDDQNFTHQQRAGALLEELHAEAPDHPGLFHYLIHAYDNPALAEQAVDIAHGYDDIAPEVPHALHMPSHIFVRLGMWPEVIDWNIRSAEAALQQPVGGYTSTHHAHALDYLMYAHLQQGQDQKAREVLDEINAVDNYQDHIASAYGIAAARARYLLEREKWDEAAAFPCEPTAIFRGASTRTSRPSPTSRAAWALLEVVISARPARPSIRWMSSTSAPSRPGKTTGPCTWMRSGKRSLHGRPTPTVGMTKPPPSCAKRPTWRTPSTSTR